MQVGISVKQITVKFALGKVKMPKFQVNLAETFCIKFLTLSFLKFAPFVFVFLVFFNFHFFGEGIDLCFDGSKEGYRLDSKVAKYLHARTGADCILQCLLQDKLCISANFRKTSVCGEKVEHNCELLHAVDIESLHKDEHYDYYILRQPDRTGLHNKRSCKELLDEDPTLGDGNYNLQAKDSSEKYPVYCHMTEIPGCKGEGWTLIMKTDGRKKTFGFDSLYWTNKETYAIEDGLEGLTERESKLASYWNTPFKKICLGMSVDGDRKWMTLDYEASSLYSVIADEKYRGTSAGRVAWKSLIAGSSLQLKCNREGFYIKNNGVINMRLGYLANNGNNCENPDSCIGFGIWYTACEIISDITCGNIAQCKKNDNGKKLTPAFGYVLVQ